MMKTVTVSPAVTPIIMGLRPSDIESVEAEKYFNI